MNKKWMILPVALLAVFGLVLLGCPEGKVPDTAQTNVFDLGLYAIAESITVGETDHSAIFDGDWLVRAGGDSDVGFEVIAGPALEVDAIAAWGAGFDLNDAKFDFQEGDEITIAGKMGANSGEREIFLNTDHSGFEPAGGWHPATAAAASFSATITLTASDVAKIKAASPKAIRVRLNNTPVGKFEISALEVTGMRAIGFSTPYGAGQ